MRALWNDAVVAESDDTVVVEGTHDFAPKAVQWDYLAESSRTGAWLCKSLAENVGRVAFRGDVRVEP
jgi:uncharacterized protein (DUF427 family)